MPLGDTTPSIQGGWGSSNADTSTATPKSRAKSKSTATMPKGTDYAPAQDLLLSAMSLIGVKYTWGGNSPESGLDCSGFIKYVFQNSMNITLPRTAFGMAQTGQNIDKTELKPGDLVFFNTLGRTFSHVGIYLGDNRFIHSPRAGRSVEVANMNQSYWQNRFNGARRIAEGGGQGLNVNAMLAATNNNARSATAAKSSNDAPQASARQCKKVTTGKGKKRKTVLQCNTAPANQDQAKPSSGKKPANSSKTATSSKPAKTATAKSSTRSTAKSSSNKKPVAKSSSKKPTAATSTKKK
ncbi:C40 family peptidase [Chitinibacter bivalviorum]|uniref:C40 family peptidase n=2 Tax=Chitinibacter bivalviorum TaxID=2739434 RepID=A0A7H9BMM2_9NEIS|nr:C40 family peptidase [Chitinibacter bivalviorum]